MLKWLPPSSESLTLEACIFYFDPSRTSAFFFASDLIIFPSIDALDIMSNLEPLGFLSLVITSSTLKFSITDDVLFMQDFLPPDFSFFLIKITYFSTSWILGISSENMLFLKLTYLEFRDPLTSELVSVVISFPSISFSFSTNFKFYSFD